MKPVDVPPGEAMAHLAGRTPVLYGALGAVLHLELLTASDEARLDKVNDLVWDWFGDKLRWATLTAADGPEPIRRGHLDHVSSYAAHLDVPPLPPASAAGQTAGRNFAKVGRTEYGVACLGGEDGADASPFSYRFWAEIGEVSPGPTPLPAYSVLHLTVTEAWPLEDFYERVCAVAACLRLRWGAAGYTYSAWESASYKVPSARLYAHARRFTGYDVAEYVGLVEPFYRRLRTVNWLTFLGAGLVAELAGGGRALASTPSVRVSPMASGALLLCAGARPERGDVNRLQIPPAYREADALVRPVRAADPTGMVFLGPWSEPAIEEWLRRFEQRVT